MGKQAILSGWRASGIADAIEMGSEDLPSLDPFRDIDSSCEEIVSLAEEEVVDVNHDEFIGCKERESQVDSDSEWEVDENRNTFSLFDE